MTIALIGSRLKQSTSSTSGVTTALDTTGATLLVAVCSDLDGGATLADSLTQTWTSLTKRAIAANNGVRIQYIVNPSTNASHVFELSGGSKFPSLVVAAFSGTVLTSVTDGENGNTQASGTTVATGSITPTETNELLIYGFSSNASGSYSVDQGSILQQAGLVGSTSFGVAMAYEIQTAATARNAIWTSGSGVLAAAVAAFKSADGVPSGGGGISIPVVMNQYRQRWA